MVERNKKKLTMTIKKKRGSMRFFHYLKTIETCPRGVVGTHFSLACGTDKHKDTACYILFFFWRPGPNKSLK
jgi:hypothetical protein